MASISEGDTHLFLQWRAATPNWDTKSYLDIDLLCNLLYTATAIGVIICFIIIMHKDLSTFGVPLPQAVENVSRVEASIVTQRAGYDLQRLSNGGNDQLLLSGNSAGIVPQVLAQFHLNSPTT